MMHRAVFLALFSLACFLVAALNKMRVELPEAP